MFAPSPETFAGGPDIAPSAPGIRLGDLTRHLHLLGADYQVGGGGDDPSRDVLRGHMHTLRLRPGLVLYRTAVEDLCTMRTSNLLHPGIKLTLLLQGGSELAYGTRSFALGPRQRGGEAAMVSLAEPDRFTRHWHRGRSERKVTLTLMPEWLDASGVGSPALQAFTRQHLAVAPWRPSPRTLAVADQLARPPEMPAALQQLWLESRCLEIAVEALAAVSGRAPEAPAPLDPRNHRRLRELREFLDSGAADGLALADIARHAGMSASHLQRHFPAVGGTGVADYLRGRRLQRARDALERGEADVAAAAHLAGYRSAANFATAFRRQFGVTPRQARCKR